MIFRAQLLGNDFLCGFNDHFGHFGTNGFDSCLSFVGSGALGLLLQSLGVAVSLGNDAFLDRFALLSGFGNDCLFFLRHVGDASFNFLELLLGLGLTGLQVVKFLLDAVTATNEEVSDLCTGELVQQASEDDEVDNAETIVFHVLRREESMTLRCGGKGNRRDRQGGHQDRKKHIHPFQDETLLPSSKPGPGSCP